MKAKEIIIILILILLGIVSYFLVKNHSSHENPDYQTAQAFDMDEWEANATHIQLADWAHFTDSLPLTETSEKLVEVIMAEALIRDMIYNSQDARFLEYELNMDSLIQLYTQLTPALFQSKAGKNYAKDCIQKFKKDPNNEDQFYEAAYYFILNNYPFNQYVKFESEEEFMKFFNTEHNCPIEIPTYYSDIDSTQLTQLLNKIRTYYYEHEGQAIEQTTALIKYLRMGWVKNPLNENLYYANQRIFDEDLTVFDYELYQIWTVLLQNKHGVSKTSYIPYEIHEAARYQFLQTAYKRIAIDSEDALAFNAIYQYSTLPAFQRNGTLGNEALNLTYLLKLIDYSK